MNPSSFAGTSLNWVQFKGALPDGAVSFWNSYANREEYPACISNGHIGSYSPSRGPYCFYPFAEKELKSSEFWILVNENFNEKLEWQSASWGNVPFMGVSTGSGDRFFVGKNRYGLGKVDRRNNAFFIACDGKEYWYKYYEVLTIVN